MRLGSIIPLTGICLLACSEHPATTNPRESPERHEAPASSHEPPRLEANAQSTTDPNRAGALTAPPPPAPPIPTISRAGGPCTTADRIDIGQSRDRRLRGIRIAAARDRALVAWADGVSRVTVRSLDLSGSPRAAATTYDMPAARDITRFFADDEASLLATHGLCPGDAYHRKCLFLRAFGPDGQPTSDVLEHRTSEWMRRPIWTESNSVLWLAYTQLYRPSRLTRIEWSRAGATRIDEVLELSSPDGEQPPALQTVAVDGTRWALLAHEYDGELEQDLLRLILWNGEKHLVRGIPVESAFHTMVFEGGTLHLLYSPPQGRARHTVLGLDGRARGTPSVVSRNTVPQVPDGERLDFSIENKNGGAMFVRHNLVGDPIGDSVPLARAPVGASSVTYTGRHFLAAWVTTEQRTPAIHTAAIHCQPRPPEP